MNIAMVAERLMIYFLAELRLEEILIEDKRLIVMDLA
jgi:hypothetical protein